MRLIIALAVVTWSLIVITTALSFKTIAATQIKTEARAHSAPIYGVIRATAPNGMKALPVELVPLP